MGRLLQLLLLCIFVVLLNGYPSAGWPDEIKIGGIMDTTGPTSDVGKDYAIGMQDAFKYINDHGGVNGQLIEYRWMDYGLQMIDAVESYKLFKRLGCIAIMGWASGDTEALSPTANKDEIPVISASFSSRLIDYSDKTPYNLFFAADYDTSAKACLKTWYEKKWPKHPDYGTRNPRFACCYMFASPGASSAIRQIKHQAKLLGFEIAPDEDISILAEDTTNQIESLKLFSPDVVWHGNTVTSVAVTLQDAQALGLDADWIVSTWAFDENLPKLAGEAAEGVVGITPCAFFGQDVKNMDKVVSAAERYSAGIPLEMRTIHTVKAWGNAMILWEALKRADAVGVDLTQPGCGEEILKYGFETMRDFDIGLGAPPITFTASNHRPTTTCIIQEWRDGQFRDVQAAQYRHIYVSNGNCGGNHPCYTTIQDAIDAVQDGGTIDVAAGTYNAGLQLTEAKDILLQGGWDSEFETQTANTTVLTTAPKALNGSITLRMLSILPDG
ncbi:MAG: ABC transporter substrate-binding protein [Deltaproteobacteria bacterium]|nr:ABC transporter substrate-binding protein [Deltaproteobacteria bacterium]